MSLDTARCSVGHRKLTKKTCVLIELKVQYVCVQIVNGIEEVINY